MDPVDSDPDLDLVDPDPDPQHCLKGLCNDEYFNIFSTKKQPKII